MNGNPHRRSEGQPDPSAPLAEEIGSIGRAFDKLLPKGVGAIAIVVRPSDPFHANIATVVHKIDEELVLELLLHIASVMAESLGKRLEVSSE